MLDPILKTSRGRCPLFVELCAGTAAVSLRLQGGRRCRPPVSRMGAKTGYASEILALFGLTAGRGADAYLWCEPDDGARVLLQALPQPDVLKEAAAILRGWSSEDSKTLWDSLRDEGAPKGVDGREVARWQFLLGSMWVHKQDGRPMSGWQWCEDKPGVQDHARRLEVVPTFQKVVVNDDARKVIPEMVTTGTVCLIDPPYAGTTGYTHDLSRDGVIRLARMWDDAGAFVGVCEQTPIQELINLGWHAVNLTNGRDGNKRTFSKQQEEWVTLSRPPVNVPLLGSQPSLFGGADAR